MAKERARRSKTIICTVVALSALAWWTADETPVVPPSPAQYRTALAQADAVLGPAFERVRDAKDDRELKSATDDYVRALQDQAYRFGALRGPRLIGREHSALVDNLKQLALYVLHASKDSAPPLSKCDDLLPARLVIQDWIAHVTYELRGLAFEPLWTNGYPVGEWAPPVATPDPAANRRLADGEVLVRSAEHGRGALHFTNGDEHDLIVSVTHDGDPADPLTAVFVHAGSEVDVPGLDGEYEVFTKWGTDWDADRNGFARECGFRRIDPPLVGDAVVDFHRDNKGMTVVPPF